MPRRKLVWLVLLSLTTLTLAVCVPGKVLSVGSGWSAVIAAENTVYVGTIEGEILALDASAQGKRLWTFPTEEADLIGGVYGTPQISGELLYVGGYNGKLYALRRESGQLEWQKGTQGRIIGGPAIAADMVLVGSSDGKLYAFSALDGRLEWSFPSDGKVGEIWSTPAIHDGKVIFGSMDHSVYAISLEDGKELWRFETGGAVPGGPLIVGDVVVVGSFDRTLYALDVASGVKLWTFDARNWFWAGPVQDGTHIYAADMGGNVYSFTPRGEKRWSVNTGSPIVSQPLVLGDTVVVASEGGRLYFLSARGGTERDIPYNIGSSVRAPLTGEGAVVFFGVRDKDHSVQGFDVKKGQTVWKIRTKK